MDHLTTTEYTMSGNIPLNLAQKRVHAYAEQYDDVIALHHQAMDRMDCEEFLQLGIDALKSLRMAEETLREAAYEGIFEFRPEVREALDTLYNAWLRPCEAAGEWIERLRLSQHVPDNLDAFRKACEIAHEIVGRRDWRNRTSSARALCEAGESW
jgi:hypothetical protein